MSALENKIKRVHEKIAEAFARSKYKTEPVTLIAVSKKQPADTVINAASLGQVDFGENYVQEASKKMDKVAAVLAQTKIQWHLIGALQTNKSKHVVGKFTTIQSVDRIELAKALNVRAHDFGVTQEIMIQVKLGDEPTKGGVLPAQGAELIKKIAQLENLKIEGLMAIPPIEAEAEASRKFFIQLRELKEQWASLVPQTSGSFKHLSMGTTHDFEVAIEEGSTMVRVGTALFGSREHLES
ncbi:MAG: YggS family pyridoxal phosphate-dependent enzyme [Oligoflexia bacterium]|nr:YggS family pyridoxal phosphate-dependent enzyme [Oligoflexia bacterium]